MSESPFLGLVLVSKKEVIDSCKKRIAGIKRYRQECKEDFINSYLDSLKKQYEKAWFKFLVKIPTRVDAERAYVAYDEWFECEADHVNDYYRDAELRCYQLIDAANVGIEDTMWLSVSSVRACGMGKHCI